MKRIQPMPHKDPNLGQQLISILTNNPAVIAAFWGAFIAFLRIFHSGNQRGQTKKQVLFEMIFCGAISALATKTAIVFGVNPELGAGIGGAVGLFGVKEIKDLARRYLKQKTDNTSNDNNEDNIL